MKTVKVAIVGYGNIGKYVLEALSVAPDLDLLDKTNTVEVNGQEVSVREVTREALKKKLELGNKVDAVLLRAIIAGEKQEQQVSYEYEMVVRKDIEKNVTAMARATASTISAVAQMIGKGIITKRGVFAPETVVPGEVFIQEMAKRGVVIKETSHRSAMIVKW